MRKRLTLVLAALMVFVLTVTSAPVSLYTVQAKSSKKITLNYSTYTLKTGKKVTLKATTEGGGKVVFTSKDPSVATVSKRGVVKAKKEGKTTITATIKGTKHSAKCKIIVGTPVTRVKMDEKTISVAEKGTVKVYPTVKPKKASNKKLSYEIQDTKIAKVDKNGKITGLKVGKTKLTITATDGSKKSAKVNVVVTKPIKVKKVVVNASETTLVEQDVMKLTTTVEPGNASNRDVKWTTSNAKVATVSSTGIVTARSKGKVKITAKAKDGSKKSGSVTIKVEKDDKPVKLTDSNGDAVAGVSGKNIKYFYAHIKGTATSVQLYDSKNNLVGEMCDDGRYNYSGDDMKGDGIYSLLKTYSESEAKKYKYYAKATINGSEVKSRKLEVNVIAPMSEADKAKMTAANSEIKTATSKFTGNKKSNAKKAKAVLEKEKKAGNIKKIGKYDSGMDIYPFTYSDGSLGGIALTEMNDKTNGELAGEELGTDGSLEDLEEIIINDTEDTYEELTVDGSDAEVSDDEITVFGSDNTEGEKRTETEAVPIENMIREVEDVTDNNTGAAAKTLNVGLFFGFENTPFRTNYYSDLYNTWNNSGIKMTKMDATVNNLMTLSKYNMIVFSMHGSIYDGTPVLCTNEVVSDYKNAQYYDDLYSKRIVIVTDTEGNTNYWVKPDFFTDNYSTNDLSDRVVFSETCDFMGEKGYVDYSMANSLLGSGAAAVVGFHNSVLASYSRNMMKLFVENMSDGMKAGKALDDAKYEYGYKDGGNPAAYAILSGDENATFAVGMGLINGSFENSPNFAGWDIEGDARVIYNLSSLTPRDGKKMALITTGIGSKTGDYNGTEGSYVKQEFQVPSNASKLSFSYDVVSEEPMEYVGSKFDDKFAATVLNAKNEAAIEMAGEAINTSTWIPIENVDFDGGDSTAYHTGWKNVSVDVSAYRGKKITVLFKVWDVGDSLYDTAAVIDNVVLK